SASSAASIYVVTINMLVSFSCQIVSSASSSSVTFTMVRPTFEPGPESSTDTFTHTALSTSGSSSTHATQLSSTERPHSQGRQNFPHPFAARRPTSTGPIPLALGTHSLTSASLL